MKEQCERCRKIPKQPQIINPHNETVGFSDKRTVLCENCRKLWHIAFAIVNHGSGLVENKEETKEAWRKFMAIGREKVEFT